MVGYGTPKEFYRATAKYPASEVLAKLFGLKVKKVTGSVKTHARADVVSPELCDDVLGYIGPQLDSYHGCDIIDVNPGACVWSQRIHELLRPRTHILLEPEKKYHKSFIKPLIAKDSTYKFLDVHGTHLSRYWSTYEKLWADGLLPKREDLSEDDSSLRRPNRKLLVTGNMQRWYKVDGFKKAGMVNSFSTTLGHFIHSAQSNTLFHKYGLVKMLLWAPEQAKLHTIPWLIQGRTTMSASFDLVADITEVAGRPGLLEGSEDDKRGALADRPRPFAFDKLSSFWTRQRMQTSNLSMPSGRTPPIASEVQDMKVEQIQDLVREVDINVKNPPGQSTLAEHQDIVRQLSKSASAFMKDQRSMLRLKKQEVQEVNRPFFEKSIYKPVPIPFKDRFATFIRLSKLQVEAEAAFCHLAPVMSAEQRSAAEKRLLQSAADIRDGIYGKNTLEFRMYAERFRILFDEQRCLLLDKPPLAFDYRPYEALATRREDFWPDIPLMLLEINPLERNFASDITSKEEATSIMRGLLKGLYGRKGLSVWDGLDAICPGAGEDMYEAVPELKNPRYGGRLDPKDLKIYALPRILLEKLVVAYLEWPFRPSEHEMAKMGLGSSGSTALDGVESEQGPAEGEEAEEEV
ncbi:Hypothetical protein D9617_1g081590 [Elsinoe fawcettii]|nr:Hypothetical protein D9617_1g081590 [Elsinoe fawcettii]